MAEDRSKQPTSFGGIAFPSFDTLRDDLRSPRSPRSDGITMTDNQRPQRTAPTPLGGLAFYGIKTHHDNPRSPRSPLSPRSPMSPRSDGRRISGLTITPSGALPSLPLPNEVFEAYLDGKKDRGLTYHVLEAGHGPGKPLVLLIHGFPSGVGFNCIWSGIELLRVATDHYTINELIIMAFCRSGFLLAKGHAHIG